MSTEELDRAVRDLDFAEAVMFRHWEKNNGMGMKDRLKILHGNLDTLKDHVRKLENLIKAQMFLPTRGMD